MPAAQAVTFMVPEALADIPSGWLGWGMRTEKLQPGVLLAQWKCDALLERMAGSLVLTCTCK